MDTLDYDRVIEDLEARRAAFNQAIDNAIASIRFALAQGAFTGGGPLPLRPAEPSTGSRGMTGGTMKPEMFFGKSIPEAAITCLQVTKTPMSSPEIAAALEAAQYHHKSKNFPNTVNSILNRRAETVGDVQKFGRSWRLTEWSGRRKAAQDSGTE